MNLQTRRARARYDRLAPLYDAMEWPLERLAAARWRRELWGQVKPGRILEVGVGTGQNLPYYPPGAMVTAIDLSERMLARARHRARARHVDVECRAMDAQHILFDDGMFDAAVGTFVLCSIPDPVRALRELARVVRPGGDIWLLEHVRVDRLWIGRAMDLLNPVVVRLTGANINRNTVENVLTAGLRILEVTRVTGELVKRIHARPGATAGRTVQAAENPR